MALTDDEILALKSAAVVLNNHSPEDLRLEHQMAAVVRVGVNDIVRRHELVVEQGF